MTQLDDDTIDPNGDGAVPDNGYRGNGDEWLPVTTAEFYNRNGGVIISCQVGTNGLVSFAFKPGSDIPGTYHPGDNWIIEAKHSSIGTLKDTVSNWKRMRIEYDHFTGYNFADSAWWCIKRAFSGYDVWPNDSNLYFNMMPWVEFENDDIHLLKNSANNIIPSNYHIRESYIFTDLKYLLNNYRDSSANWPFYLVAADSVYNASANYYGITYFPDDDSTNEIAIIFFDKIKKDTEVQGWSNEEIKKYNGVVAIHELGHFMAFLNDYKYYETEHTDTFCVMNATKRGMFCSECIKYIRGTPRKRGPIIF